MAFVLLWYSNDHKTALEKNDLVNFRENVKQIRFKRLFDWNSYLVDLGKRHLPLTLHSNPPRILNINHQAIFDNVYAKICQVNAKLSNSKLPECTCFNVFELIKTRFPKSMDQLYVDLIPPQFVDQMQCTKINSYIPSQARVSPFSVNISKEDTKEKQTCQDMLSVLKRNKEYPYKTNHHSLEELTCGNQTFPHVYENGFSHPLQRFDDENSEADLVKEMHKSKQINTFPHMVFLSVLFLIIVFLFVFHWVRSGLTNVIGKQRIRRQDFYSYPQG
jgi:hypothetical protein